MSAAVAGRPGVPLELAGEEVLLLADRALWWPASRALLVADLHLGKEDVFRAGGIPVPPGSTAGDLRRLASLVTALGARHLVVLGDFFHGPASRSAGVLEALAGWRHEVREVDLTLVRGNHDRHAGDPPPALKARVVEGPWEMGPFALRHEPSGIAGDQGPGMNGGNRGTTEPGKGVHPYELAGHLHPAVRLEGPGRGRMRLPCFWVRPDQGVLPAFGGFTGSGRIRPLRGDRVFVVGDGQVIEVPVQ